ncbi:MAG: AI-2E family transporter [Eubacteriales bacterium]|nr:AI-2E family transporter [Eubacteriales bacterium]
MKDQKWNQYIAWGITAFAVLAAAAGVIFLFININVVLGALSKVIGILMPVIYGAIMAYLMAPIYNRVCGALSAYGGKRAKLARLCATLVSVIVLLAIAIGLVSMMLPELYRSVMNVLNSLPGNVSRFSAWLDEALSGKYAYQDEILILYNNVMDVARNFLNNELKPNITLIIGQTYTSVMSAVMWLYDLIIGLIVMIYLLNIKGVLLPQLKKLIFTLLPEKWAERTISELQYINTVFGGFIIGKILDSLIIGILCFGILSLFNMIGIFRMPYVLLVSVIIGVTNVIPFFGPFIGAIPSTILIMLSDPWQGVLFLIFVFLLQQFDGNYLGPKILGDRTGLSSFWVLFSILLFGGLFGFVGMIIAVPTWAVFMNLISQISSILLKKKGLPVSLDYYKAEGTSGLRKPGQEQERKDGAEGAGKDRADLK